MSTSSDSAEQVVDIYIKSVDMGLKLAGKMAMHMAVILTAILKEKKQTKGKTRLNGMLKTGKELKIYSIKKEDLKIFTQEAKSYGVLYCALINTKSKKKDDIVDIMVKAEDAPKINRIIERFKLTTVNMTNVEMINKKEIVKEDKTEDILVNEQIDEKVEENKIRDEEIDDVINNVLFGKKKEEKENPLSAKTEKNPPLEHFSKNKNDSVGVTETVKKKSVREELKEIQEGQKEKVETELGQVLKKDKEIQSK